ncbi:fused response regulator/phosphatase [Alteromonas sp. C1M14]|uniref:ATP-binding SpoIIE family protein phosphatase n=1 Tax=Alteromonas sp. C1M14 TaxID=2841567 RepID=UPI001C0A0905|nr:fused response regulator/phosphatase [Alteromonas sp. C1M14]MBU2977403.1 fused response regulator/phosphatase [Alteromonas sp. C1M14]
MRILIVDDESLNRFLLRHMLEQEGYTDCFEASDGQDAINKAAALQPDLILLDVIMPGLSGYAVAPQLKQNNGSMYLPIIFITSLDDKASLARCLEVGGDDFVSKPFDRVILAAKIRAHGRIRELSREVEQQNAVLRYHRQAVDREHAIVENIFNNAVVNNPQVEHFFDVIMSPAAKFNGDVFLCEVSPAGGAFFLMGDFTGHGLASAIGVLPVSNVFKNMVKHGMSVGEVATAINKILLGLLPADMFLAAIIMEIDVSGCRFSVWSGGMPQVLLKNPDTGAIQCYPSRHMALGILEVAEFDDGHDVIEAEQGQQLLVYTDGIMEVMDANGNMADEEGVKRWFSESALASATGLYEKAVQYRGEGEQADDMSIVLFTCKSLKALHDQHKTNELPYTITLNLCGAELQNKRIIDSLMDMLSTQVGICRIRSDLFTVLSELFNNALEHGVLALDSSMKHDPSGFAEYYSEREKRLARLEMGWICFVIRFLPQQDALEINLRNSGEGFDTRSAQSVGSFASYGRGISLIRELCDDVTYSEGGSQVQVKMSMKK